ncbi:MAG TPA: polyprenyl synthetase family protein [Methylophilus sp.]|nr:polyprenyl synthetase family protein [Methylophilus sp.]HQQ33617.1 polyprenyl synthetase family protein [Methylophilus sp.]
MTLNHIQSQIAADMQAVDAVIRSSLTSEVALINTISEHIIGGGGKRLRPALVLLSGGMFGKVSSQHHQLAAIVECIHTATLLHDDVVDESHMRRGKSTANHLFGNAASVLVGDFLYSRAFQMMVKLQNMRVMEVLSEATNTIAEGEVLQLMNVHNADVSEVDYIKVIHFKTAKLFEAAARLGAITHADCSFDDEENLARYGMHLGTAFQLVDDVLDLSGDADTIGKNLGDDLNEGKPTLPLLYAMRHGNEANSKLIRDAILHGGLDTLPQVLAAVNESGAKEHVLHLARKESHAACAAIAHFKDNAYKQSMIELADFAVNRSF